MYTQINPDMHFLPLHKGSVYAYLTHNNNLK